MPTALVAGAGIAGLTAALALARRGWHVRIRERAAALEAVGAGIQLSPNALDVLERLGIPVETLGVLADSVVLRDGPSGRRIAAVPVASSDGRGYRVLHRAALQSALLDAVTARSDIRLDLGRALVTLLGDPRGVRAQFAQEGSTGEEAADVFVAADGVRSAAAALLDFPGPVPSGATALRFAAEGEPTYMEDPAIEAWLGPRRHAVRYRIDDAGRQNLVVIVPDREPTPGPLLRWDPRLARLIERARPLGAWPLATVAPRWRAPGGMPIVFVGDAAHAMLPYAAQGAAMAIEDAFVLAACLEAHASVAAALAAFEAARAPRVEKVLGRVRFHRRVYHLPRPLSFARDAALALRSPASLRRDLAWLYDWRAGEGESTAGN